MLTALTSYVELFSELICIYNPACVYTNSQPIKSISRTQPEPIQPLYSSRTHLEPSLSPSKLCAYQEHV